MSYKVETLSFQDLQEQETRHISDNGWGKENASYLRITVDGVSTLQSDAMEPEDVKFHRDLSWIADALMEAYEVGRRDGAS